LIDIRNTQFIIAALAKKKNTTLTTHTSVERNVYIRLKIPASAHLLCQFPY